MPDPWQLCYARAAGVPSKLAGPWGARSLGGDCHWGVAVVLLATAMRGSVSTVPARTTSSGAHNPLATAHCLEQPPLVPNTSAPTQEQ